VKDEGRINIDEIVDEALVVFSNDTKFMKDLAATAVPWLIRNQLHHVFTVGRRHVEYQGVISPLDDARKRVASTPWKFHDWTESTGNRWQVRLLELTGTDLDYAIERRAKAGVTELRRSEFLATLRKQVGDDETVGDKWTKEDIEKAWEKANS
jgi:hypothetical protein